MARKRKPRAYLQKEFVGQFCWEPIVEWVARSWGHMVATGKTRKECEERCRERGYVPESY